MKEEVLKEGLSIEELEERAEFIATATEAAAAPNEGSHGMCNPCTVCSC
jgi:hypothetical protein